MYNSQNLKTAQMSIKHKMDEWITEYLHNKILYCSGSELLYVTMGKFHNLWAKKRKKLDRKELSFMC